MFRKRLLSLSSVVRNQYKIFTLHDQSNSKTINYADVRQKIIDLFLFLRDSLRR